MQGPPEWDNPELAADIAKDDQTQQQERWTIYVCRGCGSQSHSINLCSDCGLFRDHFEVVRASDAADRERALEAELEAAYRGEFRRPVIYGSEAVKAQKAEAENRALAEALRYIAGEDVAGMEPHQRPQDVARAALSSTEGAGDG